MFEDFTLPGDINIAELILMTVLAAAMGWKAATELKLASPVQALVFAVTFGLLGTHCLDLALVGGNAEFRFGGVMHTMGFAVVGVVVSWMLQSAVSAPERSR
jgi:hypothetical protein